MTNDLLDDGVSPGEGGREAEGRSAMIHKREQH